MRTAVGAPAPPPAPDAGSRVRVVVRDQPSFVRVLGELVRQGAPLEPVVVTLDELYRDYVRGNEPWDIMLALSDWVPEMVQRGVLAPLSRSGLEVRGQYPDYHSALLDPLIIRQPDGAPDAGRSRLMGLPFHVGPEVFHYRRDLFENPTERAAFRARFGRNLHPPDTWSQFVEVATHFTRDGLWGCCFGAFPDGHNDVYDFLIHLWSRGGDLADVASQAGIDALSFYHDLVHVHKVAPPECLKLNSVESGAHYAEGKVAMMWNWAGFATVAEQSSLKGKNAVSVIPRGDNPEGRHASINAFWAWVVHIPYRAPKRRLSEALDLLTSLEVDILSAHNGNCPAHQSVWQILEPDFPYFSVLAQAYDGAHPVPSHPNWGEACHLLSKSIAQVMQDREDPAQILGEIAPTIRDLLA